MAEMKKKLVDYGLDILRDLLNKKPEAVNQKDKKFTLDDVTLDELKKDQVRLDQGERQMLSELRELESTKRKLFEDGVRNPSEREQRVIARRIKEVDMRAQNVDRMLQHISKQMRVVSGLVQIKERARMNSEWGITSLVGKINLDDLIGMIGKITVDEEFQWKKFDELLRTMEHADRVSPEYADDNDVQDILREMQLAREAAEGSPEAIDEHFNELNRKMEEKIKAKEASEEDF